MLSSKKCLPCQDMKPAFKKVAEKINHMSFGIAEYDEAPKAFANLHIYCVPRLYVYENGALKTKFIIASTDYTSQISKVIEAVSTRSDISNLKDFPRKPKPAEPGA
jgi:thioredoxin-like negative regulator of GroEL